MGVSLGKEEGGGELTGNVPCSWMCVRALIMSGMESASAQSQSSMPWDVGSLGEKLALEKEYKL